MCIRKYRPDGSDGAPFAARSTVCIPPPRKHQTRLPKAGPASDRRTRARRLRHLRPFRHQIILRSARPSRHHRRLPRRFGKADGISTSRLRQRGAKLSECCKQGEDRWPRCTTTSIPVGEPAKNPRHESFSQTRLGWKAIGCGHLFREGWAPVSALSASPCWSRSRPTWR